MKRLGRDTVHYAFDRSLEPALTVAPGESFWVETSDAHRGTITDASVVYTSLDDVISRLGGANPVTGPVAVVGARPGDCLVIAVEEMVAGRDAAVATRARRPWSTLTSRRRP